MGLTSTSKGSGKRKTSRSQDQCKSKHKILKSKTGFKHTQQRSKERKTTASDPLCNAVPSNQRHSDHGDGPLPLSKCSAIAPKPESGKKGLSALQAKMMQRLEGGRFRWTNQDLYTHSGDIMLEKFQDNPELFYQKTCVLFVRQYHDQYRIQVKSWKRNPTSLMIQWIRKTVPPTFIIADMGCGEAHIARAFPKRPIKSFDLVSCDPGIVTVANCAHVPLQSASVDVCIFCLSLMGTDWPLFLLEATRVLKPKGILKISEVQSRFSNVEQFKRGIKDALGYTLVKMEDIDSYFLMFEFCKQDPAGKPLPSVQYISNALPSRLLEACQYKKR